MAVTCLSSSAKSSRSFTMYKTFRDNLPLRKIEGFENGKAQNFFDTHLHTTQNFPNKSKTYGPLCIY